MTDKESNDAVVKTIDYITSSPIGKSMACDEALFEHLQFIANTFKVNYVIKTPGQSSLALAMDKIEAMINDCRGKSFTPVVVPELGSISFINGPVSGEITLAYNALGGAAIDGMPFSDLPNSVFNCRPEINPVIVIDSMSMHRNNCRVRLEKIPYEKEMSWWQLRDIRRQEKKAKQTAYKEKFFSKRSQKKEVKINPLLAKLVAKK